MKACSRWSSEEATPPVNKSTRPLPGGEPAPPSYAFNPYKPRQWPHKIGLFMIELLEKSGIEYDERYLD
jgi:hypothetical protein